MRRTLAARCIRRIVPAAVAVALASGLPRAAEARMGGGGGGLGGGGGFGMGGLGNPGGLGGFHGGFAPGGVVGAAQRGAIGVFGSAQRRGIGVFSTAQREALGFRNGGVVAFGRGHGFSHRSGDGHGWSYGWGHGDGYGRVGIPPLLGFSVPPLLGTSVPPLATAMAPRSGGSAEPHLVGSDVGVAEVWRRDGGAWRLDPTPQSVAVWRRSDDGRWRAAAAAAE